MAHPFREDQLVRTARERFAGRWPATASSAERMPATRGARTIAADGSLALTDAQHELYLRHKAAARSSIFSVAECWTINGAIDPDLFFAALWQVTREAEALRSQVLEDADGPRQRVKPAFDGEIPFLDLSAAANPQATAKRWMRQELARPLDLARDQLWMSALLKIAPNRHLWYQRSHQLILDRFSSRLVAARVAAIYTALAVGRTPAPCRFAPLAALWTQEQGYYASSRFEHDRDYWQGRIEGLPKPITLARRSNESGGTRRATARLSPAGAARLRGLAMDEEDNPAQALIATLAAGFCRLTGTGHLVFGLAVAPHPGRAGRSVPGTPANTLPLRLSVTPALTLQELTRQATRSVHQALRHRQYRCEDLHGHSRRLSAVRIDVGDLDADLSFGGAPATPRNLSNGPVEDLAIVLQGHDEEGGLLLALDANPALYTEAELAGHRNRLVHLMEAMLDDPARPIGRIDLLGPAEHRPLPMGWSHTGPVTEGETWPALFEAQVRRTPEATAVVAGTTRLSYRELNAHANFWAHLLLTGDIGPGKLVAVALPRSEQLVVALLAVLKSGAAYLPVDPGAPTEAIAATLASAQPAALLTTSDMARFCRGREMDALFLDQPEIAQAVHRFSARDPDDEARTAPLTPDSPAYVLHSVGTTGRPKDVPIPHRALLRFLRATAEELTPAPTDRVLAATTVASHAAAQELLLPLLAGAQVVLADRSDTGDPAALARLARDAGITLMRNERGDGWRRAATPGIMDS